MIGSWYCLPESGLSESTLRDFARAGFTHFQTLDLRDDRWTPYSRAGNLRALDLCAEAGLGCFVVDDRVYRDGRPYPADQTPTTAELAAATADYAQHPAFTGFLLYDEPSPHMFPHLAETIRALPGQSLVPMFPMHDDPRFPNAFEGRDYEIYLREWVRVARPPALAYDYYPFFDPPARMPQYLENFAIALRVAAEAGLPLWYYPAIREATLAQLRFQVNLALAHGASALFHFTWHDPKVDREVIRQVNAEAAPILRALEGQLPRTVDHDGHATLARFDDHTLVVNRDHEHAHTISGVGLPPGGAELLRRFV